MAYNIKYNKIPALNFPIKLDLGAGPFPKEGFVTLDYAYEADIIWDLTKGIPLPDNSVYELYTSHCLEHFNPQEFDAILIEIVRVCQNNAEITISVPYADTPEGLLPGHYSYFNENSFKAINQWLPHTEQTYLDLQEIKRDGYSITAKYKIVKINC